MLNNKKVAQLISHLRKDKNYKGNFFCVVGMVIDQPKERYNFIEAKISIDRRSKIADCIPVTISSNYKVEEGKRYFMCGKLMSRNIREDCQRHLKVYFRVEILEEVDSTVQDYNDIHIKGKICTKSGGLRLTLNDTPLYNTLIAVNDKTLNRSSYIPVICWYKNAGRISMAEVGTPIDIYGRVQSRDYVKNGEVHTVCEVSAKNCLICDVIND